MEQILTLIKALMKMHVQTLALTGVCHCYGVNLDDQHIVMSLAVSNSHLAKPYLQNWFLLLYVLP